MCLAIPCLVKKIINQEEAIVQNKGLEIKVSSLLYPDLKEGDEVLIHSGFIIEKLNPENSNEIKKAITEWKTFYED